MGARKLNINPTSWAVTGTYNGLKYDGINVTPLPDKEKIIFSITTENGDLKQIEEVAFPVKEQSEQKFVQIMKRVVGEKLRVLL